MGAVAAVPFSVLERLASWQGGNGVSRAVGLYPPQEKEAQMASCRKRLVRSGRKPGPKRVRVSGYVRSKPVKKRCGK